MSKTRFYKYQSVFKTHYMILIWQILILLRFGCIFHFVLYFSNEIKCFLKMKYKTSEPLTESTLREYRVRILIDKNFTVENLH